MQRGLYPEKISTDVSTRCAVEAPSAETCESSRSEGMQSFSQLSCLSCEARAL